MPSQANGPGSVHALRIRSCASQKRSREVLGSMPYEKYSLPVPRTNPEIIRPPEMTSSIAISSATRIGLPCSGSAFPITPTRMRSVFATMYEAMMFGLGIVP